tara:strand:+ start:31318 stop:31965 length:648 start_codon:yes stop_codon:yes gene_type:complete
MNYNTSRVETGEIKEWMLERMVALWQSENGLSPDGQCGPKTQAALFDQRESEIEHACSPLAARSLEIARSLVGQGEEGGNNSGPFVEMLLGKEYDGDDDDDGAWCAAFVSHCISQASAGAPPFPMSFGAKAIFKNAGNYGSKSMEPKVGDIVCWDRGKLNADGTKSWQGHVGFVERVDGDIITTIEGNKGRYPSKVKRFKYELSAESRLEGFASF